MDVRPLISSLPTLVVGIAAGVSLVSFVYHYPAPLKKLSLLWVLNFCVDIAGLITKNMGIKNHWLYNIYFWIMYLVLAYLYGTQIQSRKVQQSIRWFYGLFPALVIIQTIKSGIQDLQPMVIVGGGIFMIFLVAAYFRQLYISEETESITRDPWFWFSFGFLIHFGGTVPFLGMLNFLWEHYKAFTSFYYIYVSNSFTVLLNLLIITGFLCRRNYQRSR